MRQFRKSMSGIKVIDECSSVQAYASGKPAQAASAVSVLDFPELKAEPGIPAVSVIIAGVPIGGMLQKSRKKLRIPFRKSGSLVWEPFRKPSLSRVSEAVNG